MLTRASHARQRAESRRPNVCAGFGVEEVCSTTWTEEATTSREQTRRSAKGAARGRALLGRARHRDEAERSGEKKNKASRCVGTRGFAVVFGDDLGWAS